MDDLNTRLDEIIDAFDRLYDQRARVAEVCAFLEANVAVPGWSEQITEVAKALLAIEEEEHDESMRNARALGATDELRRRLASRDRS